MNDVSANAHRLLQLMELMRSTRPGPAFARLSQLNLSISHLRALHLLASGGAMAMKDLAEQLSLTPPSVTALARRLVQTGLVERAPHADDSRVVMLSLTAEGRTLLHEIYQDHMQRMTQMLAGLAPDEQLLFLDLLERAVHAMRASAQQDSR